MRRLTPALRRRIVAAARDLVGRQWVLTSFADLMSQDPAAILDFCGELRAAVAEPELHDVQVLSVLHLDGELDPDEEGAVWGRDLDEDVETRRKHVAAAWKSWRGELSVDALLTRPSRAAAFCRDVRVRCNVAYADDAILSDLLALRKRGDLPRGRAA